MSRDAVCYPRCTPQPRYASCSQASDHPIWVGMLQLRYLGLTSFPFKSVRKLDRYIQANARAHEAEPDEQVRDRIEGRFLAQALQGVGGITRMYEQKGRVICRVILEGPVSILQISTCGV